jgi:hypothetical protein
MKFSQRIGLTAVRELIQVESIDQSLANRLWNNILSDFFDKISRTTKATSEYRKIYACKEIWKDFFGFRIDEIPLNKFGGVFMDGVIRIIKDWFFKAQWYEKYDLIEFVSILDEQAFSVGFTEKCNHTLEIESAGYRVIDNKVIQITAKEEIEEIQNALDSSKSVKPVEIHLSTSLEYLSNRENPDYRNSIKESISAVESLCIILTNDKNATLGKALKLIETKFKIHSGLKNAFSSLYGYSSDSGGIRHSLLEDDIEVTMEDARFMLITCSAFINYLIAKM